MCCARTAALEKYKRRCTSKSRYGKATRHRHGKAMLIRHAGYHSLRGSTDCKMHAQLLPWVPKSVQSHSRDSPMALRVLQRCPGSVSEHPQGAPKVPQERLGSDQDSFGKALESRQRRSETPGDARRRSKATKIKAKLRAGCASCL